MILNIIRFGLGITFVYVAYKLRVGLDSIQKVVYYWIIGAFAFLFAFYSELIMVLQFLLTKPLNFSIGLVLLYCLYRLQQSFGARKIFLLHILVILACLRYFIYDPLNQLYSFLYAVLSSFVIIRTLDTLSHWGRESRSKSPRERISGIFLPPTNMDDGEIDTESFRVTGIHSGLFDHLIDNFRYIEGRNVEINFVG